MDERSKIMLSVAELDLAGDRSVILTKRAVLEKAALLLASMVPPSDSAFHAFLLEQGIAINAPKISRGENYKGFPYVILDHPAVFNGADAFAVRAMFWWGGFFSVTLHLRGIYKQRFAQTVLNNKAVHPQLYVCVNEAEWEHEFEETNYLLSGELSQQQLKQVGEAGFLKVALKFDVKDWNKMDALLGEAFNSLRALLR